MPIVPLKVFTFSLLFTLTKDPLNILSLLLSVASGAVGSNPAHRFSELSGTYPPRWPASPGEWPDKNHYILEIPSYQGWPSGGLAVTRL